MIKILLVEDNKAISENIQQYLKTEFEVNAAFGGSEAIDDLRAFEYDIVILDLMLPEVDGMTILSYIKSNIINTGVIILTAKEELGDKLRAFDIGANDYLTKPFFMEELKARIYVILKNMGKISDHSVLELKNLVMYTNKKCVYVKINNENIEIDLTGKIYNLLEYLLLNKNILLYKEQIFQRICGYESEASEQIIEVYISILRKKLAAFGLEKYLVTKRGMGYKLIDTEDIK